MVSQTFLNAMENISSFKQKGIPFGHWLYRIAGNIMSRSFKRMGKENSLQEHLCSVGLESKPEQMDLLMYLHELPEAQQQVLTLRYIQDLSIRDVARVGGCPVTALRQPFQE